MLNRSHFPFAVLFQEHRVEELISQIPLLLKNGVSFGILNESIRKHFELSDAPDPFKNCYRHNIDEMQHLICFTAGSNGKPKAVLRSYKSWIASFDMQKELLHYSPNALSMIVGNCSHSLHFFGLMESLYRDVTPLVLKSFSPKLFFKSAQHHNPQILYVTPAHLGLLLSHFSSFELPPVLSLQYVLVGGSTVNTHTIAATQRMFPNADIREFFGSTETSYVAIKTPSSPQDSVGKLCPGVTVRILDSDCKPLPLGKVGNIWVKSNQLFKKTILGEDHSIADSDGFVHVGDMGYLDETNHLYYCGRNNHQVTIAGKNIPLTPIENFLKAFLSTDEVAVVSVTDTLKDNRLIILTTQSLSKENQRHLLTAIRLEFGALSTPKQIKTISSWPLLDSGKTNRNLLQKANIQ